MKKINLMLLTVLVLAGNVFAQKSKADDPKMNWWKEAKFGMFIHWGLYCIPGGEWNGQKTTNIAEWILNDLKIPVADYKAYANQFNPTKFNAEEFVLLAKEAGVEEIVISIKGKGIADTIQDFTYIRRTALKKNERSLGYPLLAFTSMPEPYAELAEAVSYVLKYASLVIVKNTDKDFILPLLVARQDVYSDPQKPVQVEPKVYEIGKVGKNSPVLITTNFSITYFTVAGEVEASKVPSYIVCCDAEGMSVLTAWAADKFTPETIDEAIKKLGVEKIVGHKRLVIPGYVSVMSGKLEEITGWKISVGPREASGIPNYLRNYK